MSLARPPAAVQRLGASRTRRAAIAVERNIQPAKPFKNAPARLPEAPKIASDVQRLSNGSVFQRVVEGSARGDHSRGSSRSSQRPSSRSPRRGATSSTSANAQSRLPPPDLARFGGIQPRGGELPNNLRQPVARLVPAEIGRYERLVDHVANDWEKRPVGQRPKRAHSFGGVLIRSRHQRLLTGGRAACSSRRSRT
ncbi:MAG: hypothetical protein KatS3mg060_2796 [Dehalococcoidia bacterium]|nr:MAG: hypothetical protein KatS3mg060_2796 [Dehalococcoidia bacterium]